MFVCGWFELLIIACCAFVDSLFIICYLFVCLRWWSLVDRLWVVLCGCLWFDYGLLVFCSCFVCGLLIICLLCGSLVVVCRLFVVVGCLLCDWSLLVVCLWSFVFVVNLLLLCWWFVCRGFTCFLSSVICSRFDYVLFDVCRGCVGNLFAVCWLCVAGIDLMIVC